MARGTKLGRNGAENLVSAYCAAEARAEGFATIIKEFIGKGV
jgi:hypothetical protein